MEKLTLTVGAFQVGTRSFIGVIPPAFERVKIPLWCNTRCRQYRISRLCVRTESSNVKLHNFLSPSVRVMDKCANFEYIDKMGLKFQADLACSHVVVGSRH